MTAFKITPASSVYKTTGPAFESSTEGPDSLTVDDGAYLLATGADPSNHAALLDALGAWTVTVNGTIFSTDNRGLQLGAGNKAISNITVGATGEIAGGSIGIDARSSANIKNAGLIASDNIALRFNGDGISSVTNTGKIDSIGGMAIYVDNQETLNLTNSGVIRGEVSMFMGNDKVTNNGFMDDMLDLGQGNNSYTANSSGYLFRLVAGSGDNIVNNAGTIGSDIVFSSGKNSITSKFANDITTGSGNDTVVITGHSNDIDLGAGNNFFTNAASSVIFGTVSMGAGNDKVTNTGIINGAVTFNEGNNIYLGNSVSSSVGGITAGSGDDIVNTTGTTGNINIGDGKNSVTVAYAGSITTGVGDDTVTVTKSALTCDLSVGNNIFKSTGLITGDVLSDVGNDTLTIAGTVTGVVSVGSGKNVIVNSGTIKGDIVGGSGIDVLTNSKTILDQVFLWFGADVVTNSGFISELQMESGNDTVTNSGLIAILDTGEGNDIVTNTGTIGVAQLGDGDDTYTSSAKVDTVSDSNGTDSVKLGAGDDTYFATGATGADGLDVIDGGAGRDFYQTGGANAVHINIDTVNHDVSIINAPPLAIAANTASSADVGFDKITGFEDATGGAGDDIIFGNASANVISGGGGADALFGFAGNDTLSAGGSSTVDVLVGGLGADRLIGGSAVDQFVYLSTAESGITKTTRDVIMDFQDGTDLINLSLIDANTKNGAATNEPFSYINAGAPSALFITNNIPGQLRSYWTVTGHIIEGDTDGDGKANFSIEVLDPTHAITFDQGDFVV